MNKFWVIAWHEIMNSEFIATMLFSIVCMAAVFLVVTVGGLLLGLAKLYFEWLWTFLGIQP